MKTAVILAIVLSALINLQGCSNNAASLEAERIKNQDDQIAALQSQQKTITDNTQALQEQLEVWHEMQPNIQRLVVIEKELNLLIKQLNSLTQQAKEQNSSKPIAPIKKAQSQPVEKTFFMLQTGAFTSLNGLKESWASQQQLYPEILNNLSARYQQVQVAGKSYYRLKIGEFNNKLAAQEMCQALTTRSINCLVVTNQGIQLQ